MSNTIKNDSEFDPRAHIETERKYLPVFSEELLGMREDAFPIEQLYLSHPEEPFSLRLRQTVDEEARPKFYATLKNRGNMSDDGLERLEIETELSDETFSYYSQDSSLPRLRKQRVYIDPHTTIDFYDDDDILIECERGSDNEWLERVACIDITGEKRADNEWRAHFEFRKANRGNEALQPSHDWNTALISNEIARLSREQGFIVVTIGGRSGSGKSTVVREIQADLTRQKLTSESVSTDDYHRGRQWMEAYNNGQPWTEWDAPIVYDLTSLRRDIELLGQGISIPRRQMDFTLEEPVLKGEIFPPDVLIVEGIYARHAEFENVTDCRYELPTPLATCIGRRLMRDLRERPQFADPAKSLRYILEHAEPAYRNRTV